MIELKFLGYPEILRDGKRLDCITKKQVALLSYLCGTSRMYGREYIASLFWPEQDQQYAMNNLRQTVFQLRKLLDPGFFVIDSNNIGLNSKIESWIDIQEISSRNIAVSTKLAQGLGLDDECIGDLLSIVEYYRGGFLEGIALPDCSDFDFWQQIERDGFLRIVTNSYELLVYHCIDSAQFDRGIHLALAWLQLDSCNESAHRALMVLYARTGMKKKAVSQYQHCMDVLREELGVSPDKVTKEIGESIRLADQDTIKLRVSPKPDKVLLKSPPKTPLGARFTIPRIPGNYLVRSRLIEALDKGLDNPLTLITAPPGYGKTALLTYWAHLHKEDPSRNVIWYCADQTDNDPYHFFSMLESLVSGDSQPGPQMADVDLDTITHPSIDRFLWSINNTLVRNGKLDYMVILDDLQTIDNPAVYSGLERLIQQSPTNLHCYISTRHESMLPFKRMKAGGPLVEISTDDLRFGSGEIREFVNNCFSNVLLTKEDVHLLCKKTEGWAVGLVCAIRAIEKQGNPSAIISNLNGNQTQIMDFLVEEVIHRQDPRIQEFLVKTSILSRMDASLCMAITAQADSQQILEYLEQQNSFLTNIDSHKDWYRYHNLFSEVLRTKLKQLYGESQIRDLHGAAAHWLAKHKLYDEAVRHALEAGDYQLVARIIGTYFPQKLAGGQIHTLRVWLKAIPDKFIDANVSMQIVKAWCLIFGGSIDEAAQYVKRIEAGVGVNADVGMGVGNGMNMGMYAGVGTGIGGGTGVDASEGTGAGVALENHQIQAHLFSLRAYIAENTGNVQESIGLALQAQEGFPGDEYFFRGIMDFILGRSYRILGNLDQAEQAFERIRSNGEVIDSPLMEAFGTCDVATILQIQGRLSQSAELCRYYIQRSYGKPGRTGEASSRVLFRFAEILYERNKLKQAAHFVAKGFSLLQKWGNPNDIAFGYIELFQTQCAAGKMIEASTTLARADHLNKEHNLHQHLSRWITVCRIRYEQSRHNHGEAVRIAEALASGMDTGGPEVSLEQEYVSIEYARALVLQANVAISDQQRETVFRFLEQARVSGRVFRYLQLLTICAILSDTMGNRGQAGALLMEAVCIAEPEGYVRTFLDLGEPMRQLLHYCVSDYHPSVAVPSRAMRYTSLLLKEFGNT